MNLVFIRCLLLLGQNLTTRMEMLHLTQGHLQNKNPITFLSSG